MLAWVAAEQLRRVPELRVSTPSTSGRLLDVLTEWRDMPPSTRLQHYELNYDDLERCGSGLHTVDMSAHSVSLVGTLSASCHICGAISCSPFAYPAAGWLERTAAAGVAAAALSSAAVPADHQLCCRTRSAVDEGLIDLPRHLLST